MHRASELSICGVAVAVAVGSTLAISFAQPADPASGEPDDGNKAVSIMVREDVAAQVSAKGFVALSEWVRPARTPERTSRILAGAITLRNSDRELVSFHLMSLVDGATRGAVKREVATHPGVTHAPDDEDLPRRCAVRLEPRMDLTWADVSSPGDLDITIEFEPN